jgi:gamma-glutamyltranspeptidase / glutathione hydrolase
MRGVVAAGHPVTARAGADALRAGGNAVDAALGAMFTSFVAEPLLTGLGAGGYMLVAPPGEPPVLLDFFVEAPGRGLAPGAPHAPLRSVDVDFGDAVQVFNVGASAAGPYGTLAGAWTAARRFGRLPLAELVAPAVALARRGVEVNEQQAYLFEILSPITEAISCPPVTLRAWATCTATPTSRTRWSGSRRWGRRRSTGATWPRRSARGSPSGAAF